MNNFDDFKKAAKETMETIADKSVEFYKVAEEKTKLMAKKTKLSAEIAVEKGSVRNLYKEIGKMYYSINKNAPAPQLKQLCAEVDAAFARLEAKQTQLDALKNTCSANAEYTAQPEENEFADEEPSQSGSYNAVPPETDDDANNSEWQNKYPPEFRL